MTGTRRVRGPLDDHGGMWWIGCDPGWGPPDDRGLCVVAEVSDRHLVGQLAALAEVYLGDPSMPGPVVVPRRMAVWVPARWDGPGLDEAVAAGVRDDLSRTVGGVVVAVGAWWM